MIENLGNLMKKNVENKNQSNTNTKTSSRGGFFWYRRR